MSKNRRPIRFAGFERFAMVPEWLYSHPDITPQAIAAWIALWHYADRESHRTIVRRKLIAKLAPGSPSQATIDRWIGKLEELGAVEVTPRVTEGGQTSNEYLLHWTRPEMRTPLLTNEEGPLRAVDEGPSSPARTPIEEQEPVNQNHPDQEIAQAEPVRIVDTFDGEIHADVSRETPATRERDPHWDAMEEAFTYRPVGSEAAIWGKVLRELKDRGATPRDIIERSMRIKLQWGPGKLTATSLEKWWERFGSPLGTALETDVQNFLEQVEWLDRSDAIAAAMAEQAIIEEADNELEDEAAAMLARAREGQRQLEQGGTA